MKLESAKTSNITAIGALVLSCIIFAFTTLQGCNNSIDSRFTTLNENLEVRFKAIEDRFDRVDTTLVRMNNCIKHIESTIKEIKEVQKKQGEQIDDLKVNVEILKMRN